MRLKQWEEKEVNAETRENRTENARVLCCVAFVIKFLTIAPSTLTIPLLHQVV